MSQVTFTMSSSLVIALAVGLPLLFWVAFYFFMEYIAPKHSDLAEIYNVKRRHLEGYNAWEKRCVAAAKVCSCVSDAFFEESRKLGTQKFIGTMEITCSLPKGHPVAVAYVAAQYPDGPPYEALCEAIGVKPLHEAPKLRVVK